MNFDFPDWHDFPSSLKFLLDQRVYLFCVALNVIFTSFSLLKQNTFPQLWHRFWRRQGKNTLKTGKNIRQNWMENYLKNSCVKKKRKQIIHYASLPTHLAQLCGPEEEDRSWWKEDFIYFTNSNSNRRRRRRLFFLVSAGKNSKEREHMEMALSTFGPWICLFLGILEVAVVIDTDWYYFSKPSLCRQSARVWECDYVLRANRDKISLFRVALENNGILTSIQYLVSIDVL